MVLKSAESINFNITDTKISQKKKEVIKATINFSQSSREEEKNLKTSSCILLISSSPVCNLPLTYKKEIEGKYFQATINLINKKEFSFCTIIIVDTLARHTLKIDYPNLTDKELISMAFNHGTEWRHRNEEAINKLEMESSIVRWDEIFEHKDFNNKYEQVINLYNTDADYKETIDSSAKEYLFRKIRRYFDNNNAYEDIKILNGEQQQEAVERIGYKNYLLHLKWSIDYLLEEAAGFYLCSSLSFKKHEFDIYPSKRIAALSSTYNKLIKLTDPNILKPLSLYFQ